MPPSLKTNMLWMLVGLMFWNSVMTFLWQCRCSSTWDFCFSGVYADKVGIEAAEMLLKNIRHNGCVDEFLQDQVSVRERATRTHTLRPYSDLTLTLLCSSLSSWRWQRERLGFEPVLWHYTHRQQFTSQSSWLRSETLTAQDWPKWCLFCSRVSVLILLLYLVLDSSSGLSRADQSLTLCAVVFAGKVHNNKVRRRAEQKHHLHHRMSRIGSGEPQPVAEHAVHTLTPRSVAAPNVADPLSFCLSGFFPEIL